MYLNKSQSHSSCSIESWLIMEKLQPPLQRPSHSIIQPCSIDPLWSCSVLCSPICWVIILHAGLFTYPHGIVVHHRATIKSNSIPQTVGVICGRACIEMLSLGLPFSLKCCGTAKDFVVVLNFSHIRLNIRCCKSLTEKGMGWDPSSLRACTNTLENEVDPAQARSLLLQAAISSVVPPLFGIEDPRMSSLVLIEAPAWQQSRSIRTSDSVLSSPGCKAYHSSTGNGMPGSLPFLTEVR
jgi:hypothetical protein